MNAELIARRERDVLIGSQSPTEIMQSIPLSGIHKKLKSGDNLAKMILLRDGCVTIKSVLSKRCADSLSDYVNREKLDSEKAVALGLAEYDSRFGAVNNRRNRADMFLSYSQPIVQEALVEVTRNLSPLLDDMENMLSFGSLHELSSIISDPGSPTQCLHCDTPYLASIAPLYTFFVALQDVDDDMGHTTFLPGTHTEAAHKIFNGPMRQKDELISKASSVHSQLRVGDVAVFDSRILHAGGANQSKDKRRILFYFTFTAGDVERNNPNPKRGSGSILEGDRLQHSWSEFSVSMGTEGPGK